MGRDCSIVLIEINFDQRSYRKIIFYFTIENDKAKLLPKTLKYLPIYE